MSIKEKIEAAFLHYFGWIPKEGSNPARLFLDEVIRIAKEKK